MMAKKNPFSVWQPPAAATAPTAPYQNTGSKWESKGGKAPSSDPVQSGDAVGELGGPGAAENYYSANSGAVSGPTNQQDYYDANAGAFSSPGAGEQFWNQVQGRFSQPSGLGGYYDNAVQQTTKDMNSQLASRGQYGSSAGLGLIGDAVAGLRADQAKNEAEFNLNQTMAGSGLANAAQQAAMSRVGAGADLAAGADSSGFNQFATGMSGANAAQSAEQQRLQSMFNNIMAASGYANGVVGQGMNGVIGSDQELLDAIIAANLGLGSEGQAQAFRNTEQTGLQNAQGQQTLNNAMSLWALMQGGG
jgi:hypothetical protein